MFRILKQLILTSILAVLAVLASQASAVFISPDPLDPTAPGVGTNRYAYSFNDPINRRDPSGFASCGSGLTANECAEVTREYDVVRENFRGTKAQIDGFISQLDDNGSISPNRGQANTYHALVEMFGEGNLNRQNLSGLSSDFGTMIDRIGDPGSGIVVRFVNEHRNTSSANPDGSIAQAHPRRNLVSLLAPYRSRTEHYSAQPDVRTMFIRRILAHEVGHPSLTLGPGQSRGGGDDAYGLQGSIQLRNTWMGGGSTSPFNNIDNIICVSVQCW